MRVKFKLEPDNTITVMQEDQDTNISIKNDGEDKILIVYGIEEQPISSILPQGAED